MSKGINVLEDTVLHQLLGTNGIEELRKQIVDVIVDEVRDQLHSSSSYIISPEDVADELFTSVCEEVKEEIIEEYKSKIQEALDKKLEGII